MDDENEEQPPPMTPETDSPSNPLQDAALGYVAMGLALVQLAPGSKRPVLAEWNDPRRCVRTEAQARAVWPARTGAGIGLLHSESGTGVLDIDDTQWCAWVWWEEFGIDLSALLARYPRIRSREGKDKYLFRVPKDLSVHKLIWPARNKGEKPITVFELRAGAVQDVLPPSIHPDTGQPYEWALAPEEGFPDAPPELLAIWRNWKDFEPQFKAACPWRPKTEISAPPPVQRQTSARDGSVIESFNQANPLPDLLKGYGYQKSGKRWLSPTSSSGIPGVVLLPESGRLYSHHASDPLNDGFAHDAFDVFRMLECEGDFPRAVKTAATRMGLGFSASPPAAPVPLVAMEFLERAEKDAHPLLPGVLGDIQRFYNDTARIPQPLFAAQCALGIVSVILGRRFASEYGWFPSLYFLNIAGTAKGKEWIKHVTEEVLTACGLGNLIAGDGYTSRGAVMTALRHQPAHITVIDELGKYLETTGNKSNYVGASANVALMEAIARGAGVLRSQNYSNPHGTEKQALLVVRPAITIQAMTTPSTFYDSLSLGQIKDGFLGRFIIHHSTMPRVPPRFVASREVPASITQWAGRVQARAEHQEARSKMSGAYHGNPEQCPAPVALTATQDAQEILHTFSAEMVQIMNDLEPSGLDGLAGRSAEFAARLALIVALADDPDAAQIGADAAECAVAYMRDRTRDLVDEVRNNLRGSDFHRHRQEVLSAIQSTGENGVTLREMGRHPPFTHFKPKELIDIRESLISGGLIAFTNVRAGKPGKGRDAFIALNRQIDMNCQEEKDDSSN
jgi:hypothetical protein